MPMRRVSCDESGTRLPQKKNGAPTRYSRRTHPMTYLRI
jgi:hypothetical protein